MLKGAGRPLGVPDVDVGQYLIDAMFRIGPVRSNGMAELPTDWDLILPWCHARGFEQPEQDLIFDMCQAYAAEKAAGVNHLAIAPVDRKD